MNQLATMHAAPASSDPERSSASVTEKSTITVPEIVARSGIGRDAVYELLERGDIPATRLGPNRRWLISRRAYEQWERTFGSGEKASPRLS